MGNELNRLTVLKNMAGQRLTQICRGILGAITRKSVPQEIQLNQGITTLLHPVISDISDDPDTEYRKQIRQTIKNILTDPVKTFDISELYELFIEKGSKIAKIAKIAESFDLSRIWKNWDNDIQKRAMDRAGVSAKTVFRSYREGYRDIYIICKALIFHEITEKDIDETVRQLEHIPPSELAEKIKPILRNMFLKILEEDRPVQFFKFRFYQAGTTRPDQPAKMIWQASRNFFISDVGRMVKLLLPDGRSLFARVMEPQEDRINQSGFELEVSGMKETDLAVPGLIPEGTKFFIVVENDIYPVLFKDEVESSCIRLVETAVSKTTTNINIHVKENQIIQKSWMTLISIEGETNPLVTFKIGRKFNLSQKDRLQKLVPIIKKDGTIIIARAVYQFKNHILNPWKTEAPNNRLIRIIRSELRLTPGNELKILKEYYKKRIVDALFDSDCNEEILPFFFKSIIEVSKSAKNSDLNILTEIVLNSLIRENYLPLEKLKAIEKDALKLTKIAEIKRDILSRIDNTLIKPHIDEITEAYILADDIKSFNRIKMSEIVSDILDKMINTPPAELKITSVSKSNQKMLMVNRPFNTGDVGRIVPVALIRDIIIYARVDPRYDEQTKNIIGFELKVSGINPKEIETLEGYKHVIFELKGFKKK